MTTSINGKPYLLTEKNDLHIADRFFGQGVELESIHLLPKSRLVILQTYSTEENAQFGECLGLQHRILRADNPNDLYGIAYLADRYQSRPLAELLLEMLR